MDSEQKEPIIEYFYFRGNADYRYVGALTEKKLIIKTKNTEESFPLNKITSIKIKYSKDYYFIVTGVLLVVGIPILILFKYHETNMLINALFFIVGLFSVLLGTLGKTTIYIGQANGDKKYSVVGKNDKLFKFKDKVNSTISRIMTQGNAT